MEICQAVQAQPRLTLRCDRPFSVSSSAFAQQRHTLTGEIRALYLGLKYPDMFGRLAVVSPSVWFANKHIVHYVEALPKKPQLRIWLDMERKEGRNPEEAAQAVSDARLLKDTGEKRLEAGKGI